MEYAETNPLPEHFKIEVKLFLPCLIQYRHSHGSSIISISLKHEGEETQPRSEESIIKSRKPVDKVDLAREAVPVGKVQLSEYQNHVLIEIVTYHF